MFMEAPWKGQKGRQEKREPIPEMNDYSRVSAGFAGQLRLIPHFPESG
jgi:hypothetical protein